MSKMQWCLELVWCLYLWALGIADIKNLRVSTPSLVYGVVLLATSIYMESSEVSSVMLGAVLGGIFILVSKYTKEALGYGDSMVITIVSMWLGGYLAIYTIGGAFGMSAIYGGIRKTKEIPFLPFLAVAFTLSRFLC